MTIDDDESKPHDARKQPPPREEENCVSKLSGPLKSGRTKTPSKEPGGESSAKGKQAPPSTKKRPKICYFHFHNPATGCRFGANCRNSHINTTAEGKVAEGRGKQKRKQTKYNNPEKSRKRGRPEEKATLVSASSAPDSKKRRQELLARGAHIDIEKPCVQRGESRRTAHYQQFGKSRGEGEEGRGNGRDLDICARRSPPPRESGWEGEHGRRNGRDLDKGRSSPHYTRSSYSHQSSNLRCRRCDEMLQELEDLRRKLERQGEGEGTNRERLHCKLGEVNAALMESQVAQKKCQEELANMKTQLESAKEQIRQAHEKVTLAERKAQLYHEQQGDMATLRKRNEDLVAELGAQRAAAAAQRNEARNQQLAAASGQLEGEEGHAAGARAETAAPRAAGEGKGGVREAAGGEGEGLGVDNTAPYIRSLMEGDPCITVGDTLVAREFETDSGSVKPFWGRVTAALVYKDTQNRPHTVFKVVYEDGDSQVFSLQELSDLVSESSDLARQLHGQQDQLITDCNKEIRELSTRIWEHIKDEGWGDEEATRNLKARLWKLIDNQQRNSGGGDRCPAAVAATAAKRRVPLDGGLRLQRRFPDGNFYVGFVVGYNVAMPEDKRYTVLFEDGDDFQLSETEVTICAVEELLPLELAQGEGGGGADAGAVAAPPVHEEGGRRGAAAAAAATAGCGLDEAWALKEAWAHHLLQYWREKDAARQFLKALKHVDFDLREQLDRARTLVHIGRTQAAAFVLENGLFRAARKCPENSVFRRLEVRFTNGGKGKKRQEEDGVDAQGLSIELNTLFWEQLQDYTAVDPGFEARLDPQLVPARWRGAQGKGVRLFVPAAEGGATCLPTPFLDTNGDPLDLSDGLREKYRRVGNFLLRAFMNGWHVPSAFTPNLVLDNMQNLDRQYHPDRKDPYQIAADLCAVGYSWVQTMVDAVLHGDTKVINDVLDDGSQEPLTPENLNHCLKIFAQKKVLGPRQSALAAMQEGFFLKDCNERPVFSPFPLLDSITSPKIRRYIISGDEDCSTNKIMNAIDWEGYKDLGEQKTTAEGQLRGALDLLGAAGRARFLRFATGAPALGRGVGARLVARPHRRGNTPGGGRLPEASTCARTVYLPEYQDTESLFKKLEEAIQPENSKFGRL